MPENIVEIVVVVPLITRAFILAICFGILGVLPELSGVLEEDGFQKFWVGRYFTIVCHEDPCPVDDDTDVPGKFRVIHLAELMHGMEVEDYFFGRPFNCVDTIHGLVGNILGLV